MNQGFLIGAVALLYVAQACAGEVVVDNAWVRASAPGQDSAAVSMIITSKRDGQLVAVTTPAADHAEIHTMNHENGMMKMRQVESLPLQAGQEIRLGHGDHLMLVGLKRPLQAGERVPLKLVIEFAGQQRETVVIKAEVRPLGGS